VKAQPLRIIDGHDPVSGHRFGKFSAAVIAGGDVADDECVHIKASMTYGVRTVAVFWHWVEGVDNRSGARTWGVGFFGTKTKADRVAFALQAAHARGIMDVFR